MHRDDWAPDLMRSRNILHCLSGEGHAVMKYNILHEVTLLNPNRHQILRFIVLGFNCTVSLCSNTGTKDKTVMVSHCTRHRTCVLTVCCVCARVTARRGRVYSFILPLSKRTHGQSEYLLTRSVWHLV